MAALFVERLLLAMSAALVAGQVQQAHTGTRFVLMFMQNIVDVTQYRDVELHVGNGGLIGNANVNITLPLYSSPSCEPKYTMVPAGVSVQLRLCPEIRHSHADGSVSTKAVLVTSDLPITVVGYDGDTLSADAFSVLPAGSLRNIYLTAMYAPPNVATQFGIAADTNCLVSLFIKPSGGRSSFEYEGQTYGNGDRLTLSLAAYSTFLAYSVTDLSGILVFASAPIAVFTGNARTNVDYTRGSRDYAVEQAVPASQLGRSFAYAPTPRSSPGDFVKIVARFAGTQVSVYPSVGGATSVTLDNPGDVYTSTFTSVTHLVATQVVAVAVIVRSQDGAAAGTTDPADPSIYFLPAIEQCSSETRIAPRFLYSLTDGPFARSYLLVSISTGQESGLRVNGAAASLIGTCASPPAGSPLNFCSAVVRLDPTLVSNVISHVASAPFCTVIYSASDRESAATALGLGYTGGCVDSTQVRGDLIDNDCDSRVDEENCENRMDDDGDLLVDEDCYDVAPTWGYDYAVAFLSSEVFDQESPFSELELWLTPVGNQNISVLVTSPTALDVNKQSIVNVMVNVAPGALARVQLPGDFRLGNTEDFGNSQWSPNVLRVQATSKEIFYLTAIDKRPFSTDSALVYSSALAGTVYYILTADVYDPLDDQSLIGIVSLWDNTNVLVHIRSGVQINIPDSGNIIGETDYAITLVKAYQGFQLQSSQDFTGTKIVGSLPFSVFVGNVRNKYPASARSRDHLYEQALPVALLRSDYSSITSPRVADIGDVFKVVAIQDATTVVYQYSRIPDLKTTNGSTYLARAGDFFVIDPGYSCTIHIWALSSKLLLVGQLVKSMKLLGEEADTSLIILPPWEQAANEYHFATPMSHQVDPSNGQQMLPYSNYLLLVVNSSFHSTITCTNDRNVTRPTGLTATWHPVPGTQLVAAVVGIDNGVNVVANVPQGVFTAVVYGALPRESYGSALGLSASSIQLACVIRAPVIDDGVDNDCDSRVDEELVDGIDNDYDGLVDEDTRSVGNMNATYYVVYEENTVEYPRLYALELHVGAQRVDTTCLVTTPFTATPSYNFSFSVSNGKVKHLAFSPSLRLNGPGTFSNSFRIDCSAEVTVMALNKNTLSADGFVAFEAATLGVEYVIVTYQPDSQSQYAVLATQPGTTTVTIGAARPVSLDQNQVYQVQGVGLGGTRVIADKKIAVYSGSVRTAVGLGSRSRDHLAVQLPPVGAWGTSFNLVPTAGRAADDVYQVVAGEASASVTLCCQTTAGPKPPFSVTAGQPYQFTTQEFCHLNSSAPVLVTRVSASRASGETIGDPSMIVVVPESQYGHGASLTMPYSTGGFSTLEVNYAATLTIIVATADPYSLLLNGISVLNFIYEPTVIPCSAYASMRVLVPSGLQDIYVTHSQPNATFTVVLDGNADRESYSVTASQQLPAFESPAGP